MIAASESRMVPTRPNLFVLGMHKAASTFVADELLRSIHLRTSHYRMLNLGSEVLEFLELRQNDGSKVGWTSVDGSFRDYLNH